MSLFATLVSVQLYKCKLGGSSQPLRLFQQSFAPRVGRLQALHPVICPSPHCPNGGEPMACVPSPACVFSTSNLFAVIDHAI